LDFRFWILDWEKKYMNERIRIRSLHADSDNLKSKTCPELRRRIKNLKWVGLVAIGVTFGMCGAVAEAQQQAKVLKIGWLGVRPASGPGGRPGGMYEAIQRALREIGYVEGNNVTFEYRSAENKFDRLPALADELVRLKVDLLLTPAGAEALAAKKATRTIPIVFYGVGDPVAAGLVDSLARPGGNITGFTTISAVLVGKRLELLKETVPKLSRVAVLWNPKNPGSEQSWKESQFSARVLGLQLYSMEVSGADKFESAFKEAIKAGSAALFVISNPLFSTHQKKIADLAAKNRLPAIYPRGDFIESGGLMSYGPDQVEPYRRAAWMVDKILKGTKPADIPVEQPTKFELMINLKTAKALGLTIPSIVMMRAEKVIK
jgi:putative tryptophan/tyrosine transport system substrate-binding protein